MNASMPRLIALNKPYGVICQFTPEGGHPTLAGVVRVPRVYPAGRLDTDSEGLLLLTDHGPWQAQISQPRNRMEKTYWAQVEGTPVPEALSRLAAGVTLKDGPTLPCKVTLIREPTGLWPRDPPIRFRANIPTHWLEITLSEGRNRQVRRMTAAIGHPTLRLIRAAIGPWRLDGLQPGDTREMRWPEAPDIARPATPEPRAPHARAPDRTWRRRG